MFRNQPVSAAKHGSHARMLSCESTNRFPSGEMAEWLKAHAWKACIGETLSRVRIPVSPPFRINNLWILSGNERHSSLSIPSSLQSCGSEGLLSFSIIRSGVGLDSSVPQDDIRSVGRASFVRVARDTGRAAGPEIP